MTLSPLDEVTADRWHWARPTPREPRRPLSAVEITDGLNPRKLGRTVPPMLAFALARRLVKPLNEMYEVLPRCRGDDIVESSRFTDRSPEFQVTAYRAGAKAVVTA